MNLHDIPCSSNRACKYYPTANLTNDWICGFQWVPCSQLIECNSTHDECSISMHVCIHYDLCRSDPVCYPLAMTDFRICPRNQSKRI